MKHHDEPRFDNRVWLAGKWQVWCGLHEAVVLLCEISPSLAYHSRSPECTAFLFPKSDSVPCELRTLGSVPGMTMASQRAFYRAAATGNLLPFHSGETPTPGAIAGFQDSHRSQGSGDPILLDSNAVDPEPIPVNQILWSMSQLGLTLQRRTRSMLRLQVRRQVLSIMVWRWRPFPAI